MSNWVLVVIYHVLDVARGIIMALLTLHVLFWNNFLPLTNVFSLMHIAWLLSMSRIVFIAAFTLSSLVHLGAASTTFVQKLIRYAKTASTVLLCTMPLVSCTIYTLQPQHMVSRSDPPICGVSLRLIIVDGVILRLYSVRSAEECSAICHRDSSLAFQYDSGVYLLIYFTNI